MLATASHAGTERHLEVVRGILATVDLDESALRCPPSWPGDRTARAAASAPSRLAMNCSGKHAAMLATCVLNGWPTGTYTDPAHPLQLLIRETAEAATGEPVAFTGVDGQTSIVLGYASGAHALLSTTLHAAGPNRAAIVGTEGRIEIDGTWYAPTSFTLTLRSGEVTRYDEPHEGHGLRHEAAEVVRCLRAGLLESPVMPPDETVAIMRTMDEIRAQIGLHYPPR